MLNFAKVAGMVKVSTRQFLARINEPTQTSAADAFFICVRALGLYTFEMVVLAPLTVVIAVFNEFTSTTTDGAFID